MSEKLDNDVFKIKRIDGEALSGDANKLKLLVTSYSIIMEVQEAYIEEEIAAKEEEKRSKTVQSNIKNSKNEISELTNELNSLYDIYTDFTEAHKRFVDYAKKALSLPEENLKELVEKGWTKIEGKKVTLKGVQSAADKAQSVISDAQSANLFSNIDTNAIKEEVEKVINEYDYTPDKASEETKPLDTYIEENIDANNIESESKDMATYIKEEVDKRKAQEIDDSDIDDIISFSGKGSLDDIFSKADNVSNPESKKEEPETKEENTATATASSNDPIDFSGDKSIQETIESLERRNQELTSKEEELNDIKLSMEDQEAEAIRKRDEAKKASEIAKQKALEQRKQLEEYRSYMPRVEELRNANKEQEKRNSAIAEEVNKKRAYLNSIKEETLRFENETSKYEAENKETIKEYKKLLASIYGTDDEEMTGGEERFFVK